MTFLEPGVQGGGESTIYKVDGCISFSEILKGQKSQASLFLKNNTPSFSQGRGDVLTFLLIVSVREEHASEHACVCVLQIALPPPVIFNCPSSPCLGNGSMI